MASKRTLLRGAGRYHGSIRRFVGVSPALGAMPNETADFYSEITMYAWRFAWARFGPGANRGQNDKSSCSQPVRDGSPGFCKPMKKGRLLAARIAGGGFEPPTFGL